MLPYVLVHLGKADTSLCWYSTFPGSTIFFIGTLLGYIEYKKNLKRKKKEMKADKEA